MSLESLLQESLVVLGAGAAVLMLSARLRAPSLLGLLLAGMVIGPDGLALVSEPALVMLLAEIGVVFLLFSVGLEFSLERLRQVRRIFFLGGPLQGAFTVVAIGGAALALGTGLPRAVFFGLVVMLSSTAIVLKLYKTRRQMNAPQGRVALGILLFQDFMIVPAIVVTPILAGSAQMEGSTAVIALRAAAALAGIGLAFVASRFLLPLLFERLARAGAREATVFGALFACLGMAYFTEHLGFSLALGAFVAGMVIAESGYAHQAVADVAPFRDVFASVFFISIGMLMDFDVAAAEPVALAGIAAGILAIKVLTTAGAVTLVGFPVRVVALASLALAQIGEFSFVLLEVGRGSGLISATEHALFIGAAVITMLLTPGLFALADRVAPWLPDRGGRAGGLADGEDELRDHVVIIGYRTHGRVLSRVLGDAGLPHRVVDLDPEAVRAARAAGVDAHYGDATRPEILEHAGVTRARVLAAAVSDPASLRRLVRTARQLAPKLRCIALARDVGEIDDLRSAGADEILAGDYETGIEIFTRVLQHYHVPSNVIRTQTRILRAEAYEMLRAPMVDDVVAERVLAALRAGTTDTYQIQPGTAADGRTLRELHLRRATGATIIAVVRDDVPLANPDPDFRLRAGDLAVLVGSHAAIESAFGALGALPEAETPEAERLREPD